MVSMNWQDNPQKGPVSVMERLNLLYGEFLAGRPRDITDLVSKLVKAQRYHLLQGEFSTGVVKRALQVFADLLPVPVKPIYIESMVSLSLTPSWALLPN